MRKIIALLLALTLVLSGCTQNVATAENTKTVEESSAKEDVEEVKENEDIADDSSAVEDVVEEKKEETPEVEEVAAENEVEEQPEFHEVIPEFYSMDEEELLDYVEDSIYMQALEELDSDKYCIEDVSAIYLSEEYLAELEYNSKSNVFYGYTLAELDEQFQGERYVFTLGEDGTTVVEKVTETDDDTYNQMIRNVAIGTGVILVCVTVSVLTAGAGTAAISVVFATAAKSAAIMAASSAGIGAVTSGIVKGIETQNPKEALKAAALAGREGFKWGAISGAIIGGAQGSYQMFKLSKALTNSRITLNQAAFIQRESKYPIEVINQFKSMEEYEVYKQAGLTARMVNGKIALVRDIDLNYVSKLPDGTQVTNLQRMQQGYAPIDSVTGKAYQLHHIDQEVDGTLAILNATEHQGNASILNEAGKIGVHNEMNLSDAAWSAQKKAFWKSFASSFVQ